MGELSLEHSKSEKLYNNGLFLSKAFSVSARKCQGNYVSWHWRVMQNLKEIWLVAWKITEGICLIFKRAVEDLEICTLMGFFCPKHIKIFKWKSTEELCLIILKSGGKFEEKTDS